MRPCPRRFACADFPIGSRLPIKPRVTRLRRMRCHFKPDHPPKSRERRWPFKRKCSGAQTGVQSFGWFKRSGTDTKTGGPRICGSFCR